MKRRPLAAPSAIGRGWPKRHAARHRGRIGAEPHLGREHVRRAERNHRERQTGPREPVDGLIDRTVATGRDHHIERVAIDRRGKPFGVARRFGLAQHVRAAVRAQLRQDGSETLTPVPAGRRIENDQ